MRVTLPTLILVVAAFVMAATAIFIGRRRDQRLAGTSGTLIFLGGALWTLSNGLEFASLDLKTALFWDLTGYPGIVSVPTLLLIFILQYTRHEEWLTRRTLAILSIVPLITLTLAITNVYHGWMWSTAELINEGAFSSLQRTWGLGFIFYALYGFAIVLIGVGILLQALVRGHRIYRWQFIALLLAIATPVIGGVVDLLGLTPPGLPRTGATAAALALTGPLVIFGLYRLRLGDIVPIARDRIIDGMGDAVIVLDDRQRILDINPSACALLGIDPKQAVGTRFEAPWDMPFPAGDDPTQPPVQMSVALDKKHLDVKLSLVPDWRGRPIGQVVVLRDMTSLQRHSHELATLLEASQTISYSLDSTQILMRIAEQMGRAVDATSAYICSFDRTANQATVVAEYIGLAASQEEQQSDLGVVYYEADMMSAHFAAAMLAGDLFISHLDDPSLPASEHDHLQKYGAKTVIYIPLHVKNDLIGFAELWESRQKRTFTGEEIALCQAIAAQAAVALQNATLYEELGQYSDRLEQLVDARTTELRIANENLIELSRVKNEFISNVSHELRTPITNLKLYHNLLTRHPAKRESYMRVLERETERLRNLVESLLSLSRLDQEGVALDLAPLDLNALATTFVEDRRFLAADQGVRLDISPALGIPRGRGDANQIGQVLSILLTNALNYTPHGGTVMVSTCQQQEAESISVGVSVCDNGPGILPDEQQHLFERFFRGQAALESGAPGTGLGLAIAEQIMTRHGGRIEVESTGVPGQETIFTIWLPAIQG